MQLRWKMDIDKKSILLCEQRPILYLHLVSDSSGETVSAVGQAVVAQFAGICISEYAWPLIRSISQVNEIANNFTSISERHVVIHTMADGAIRNYLIAKCHEKSVPCICPMQESVMRISKHIGISASRGTEQGKHVIEDDDYIKRMECMGFALSHDDGAKINEYCNADIIILGVSRTSKSPTSLYLAQRNGYKVANLPIVLGIEVPDIPIMTKSTLPLIVGMTVEAEYLANIREHRLCSMYTFDKEFDNDTIDDDFGLENKNIDKYIDKKNVDIDRKLTNYYMSIESIKSELAYAHDIFRKWRIPVINVTRKAVEEIAASIVNIMYKRNEKNRNRIVVL